MASQEVLDGPAFWAPTILTRTPLSLKRILLIGTCFVNSWKKPFESLGIETDILHLNSLPKHLPRAAEAYEFQVVAIPLRAVMPESCYLPLKYSNVQEFEQLFDERCSYMDSVLRDTLQLGLSNKLVTFVTNFFVPMSNPNGRFAPRYDFRNPVYFVERLNQKLDELTRTYENTYIFDVDRLSAGLGRRYIQDDFICAYSHGSIFDDCGYLEDQKRIEPQPRLTVTYENHGDQFLKVVWSDLFAQYRTLRGIDGVKMVIMDLDDTLWRGVVGDSVVVDNSMSEGWPLGVAEALIYLKRRGIVLGLVSKNEESTVRKAWPKLIGHKLTMDDFAFRRINWKPKSENIGDIIQIANILPSSVVFVDDNPVERASIEAAFPGIRTLGEHPYGIRRALLWSSETQFTTITEESLRRSEMMLKQADRELSRKSLTREEFLRSLHVKLEAILITSTKHPRFERVLELVNKTNQFNTSGKRWTQQEFSDWLDHGKNIMAFCVEDKFSDYGLVVVVIFEKGLIEQFVMSCRVAGMEVELAALSLVVKAASANGSADVLGSITETQANLPIRDLYRSAGFLNIDGQWSVPSGTTVKMPSSISLVEKS